MGNDAREAGAAGGVRVHVGGYRLAAGPQRFDLLNHFVSLVPVVRTGRLQVPDLRWHGRLAADAHELIHGLEQAVPLVADVRDVLAAEGAAAAQSAINSSVEAKNAGGYMSDEPMPSAPADISSHTRPRITSISAAVAGRSSCPTPQTRSVVAPTYEAMFCEMPFRSA